MYSAQPSCQQEALKTKGLRLVPERAKRFTAASAGSPENKGIETTEWKRADALPSSAGSPENKGIETFIKFEQRGVESQQEALKTKGLRRVMLITNAQDNRQQEALKTKGLRPAKAASLPLMMSAGSPENKGIETSRSFGSQSIITVSRKP